MKELLKAIDVTAVLQERLHPNAICTGIARAAVGNSQETWFISISGVEEPESLVLRRSAAAGTIDWSDRGVEVAVLRAVSEAGLPVPKVWWWESGDSALERPYIMIDRATGDNPDLRDSGASVTLAEDLGRWLAKLHMNAHTPELLETPTAVIDSTRSQLEMWTNRARGSKMAPAITAALYGWLAAHVPDDDAEPVLLWGDPGPHNVLTDAQGNITALLDWELAHSGHPLFDLGAARWACLGHLDRELLTSCYEQETEQSVQRETLDWFEVLACLTRSTMLFDGVRAVIDGHAQDPNVVALGLAMVSTNMLHAADLAWGLSPIAGRPHNSVEHHKVLRPTPGELDEAIARFLTEDVLPALSDPRVKRGVKIAATLLDTSLTSETEISDVTDPWGSYSRELRGEATIEDRQELVDAMSYERQTQKALLDLYGATVAFPPRDQPKN